MNKLKCGRFIGMIQEFYCTNTREYTNIPSCRRKLVFDMSRLQERIFVYTLVKLYNKANIKLRGCTYKITHIVASNNLRLPLLVSN